MKPDDRLLYLAGRAQHRVSEHIKARLKEEGIAVSHTQAGVLFLLEKNGPLSMSELSRHFGVDNSAITGVVSRLESSGFVSRGRPASDRRISLVSITEAGSREAARCLGLIKEVNEKVREGFTDEEVGVYKRFLESFFDKFPPPR